MRRLKDRDFIETREGFLFCVVGYSHPSSRIISYLKYVPSVYGRWGRKTERFSRTMPNYTIPSLLKNIDMLKKNYPIYVFTSRIFNIQMSAVPNVCISKKYFPEVALHSFFSSNSLDSLQMATIELVSLLSRDSGISKNDFGVTGSLLTGIHNPKFSDIDLIVYGANNCWKINKRLKMVNENTFQRSDLDKKRILARWVKNYPLTFKEANWIYDRKWNYGCFNHRSFSIHSVRKNNEIVEKYGDKYFQPRGIVEGEAEITDVSESLFLPSTYKVRGLEIKVENTLEEVNEISSYDGFYTGLFEREELVSVRGKLEQVNDKRGNQYFRVLIGSPECKGLDYLKPLKSSR